MAHSFRTFLHSHKLVVAIFVGALMLTVLFSGRMLVDFVYFNDPAHRDQTIEGWMTPRYVVMSHQVPPRVLRDVLDEGERGDRGDRHVTLERIAGQRGQPLDELIAEIEAAIAAHREQAR